MHWSLDIFPKCCPEGLCVRKQLSESVAPDSLKQMENPKKHNMVTLHVQINVYRVKETIQTEVTQSLSPRLTSSWTPSFAGSTWLTSGETWLQPPPITAENSQETGLYRVTLTDTQTVQLSRRRCWHRRSSCLWIHAKRLWGDCIP